MKNLMIITGLSAAFTLQSYAQDTHNVKAPEKVLSAFKAKFPEVKNAEWEMENETEWEAEFKINGVEYSASFDANGAWIETEQEIKKSEIPADILAILNKNFQDYKIEEAEIVETEMGRAYEVEIKVGKEEFEVMIDHKGILTKKQEDKEDKKENEH